MGDTANTTAGRTVRQLQERFAHLQALARAELRDAADHVQRANEITAEAERYLVLIDLAERGNRSVSSVRRKADSLPGGDGRRGFLNTTRKP